MKYEMDKVYIVKCSVTEDIYSIKTGEYYRCMRRSDVYSGCWCFSHLKGTAGGEFSYSWGESLSSNGEYFEEPFEPFELDDFIVGEKYLCIEDFWMKNKSYLAFSKGKEYVVSICMPGDGVTFTDNSGKRHVMSDKYLSYFVKKSDGVVKDSWENLVYVPHNKPTYSFCSDKPNWSLLCADLFEDNTPLAFISSGDKHYVAGIINSAFDWETIFITYMHSYSEYTSYLVFEVDNPKECKELVKKFTQRYREYHKGLRRKACNRSKKLKKTKTWGVYSYGD